MVRPQAYHLGPGPAGIYPCARKFLHLRHAAPQDQTEAGSTAFGFPGGGTVLPPVLSAVEEETDESVDWEAKKGCRGDEMELRGGIGIESRMMDCPCG